MISYSGIFRAAKRVIDQHGEGAATFATRRADLLLSRKGWVRRRPLA
jgi:hypothetical protein